MQFKRSSGILLHPTSLPGPFGIGDLGVNAFHWLDFLEKSGVDYWEILPLGPTGYGDSPYQSFSAFAANINLIDPEQLVKDGLININDIQNHPRFSDKKVLFKRIAQWKNSLLNLAFLNFIQNQNSRLFFQFKDFIENQFYWLDDFSLFMAIKIIQNWTAWDQWPMQLKMHDSEVINQFRKNYSKEILFQKFQQFVFFNQWKKMKDYAQNKKIKIIGDIPIFIAYDSADVWSHPDLFDLTQDLKPRVVAGVPPDYFSRTGQLWGNPHYRWINHQKIDFQWWINRFQSTLELVDVVRLDHFRGFAGYWEIPADATTAENGHWVRGPGNSLFNALEKSLGNLPVIAEDLGVITPDVIDLRDNFHFPGMKILQFGFGSDPSNPFLPHNYQTNCVAYTGTHDNPTSLDWYNSLSERERSFCNEYMNSDRKHIAWDMIHTLWSSVADLTIAPIQDFLEIGRSGRMNFPGRLGNNWNWRLPNQLLTSQLAEKINKMNQTFGRGSKMMKINSTLPEVEYQES